MYKDTYSTFDGTATNGRCLNINECSGSTIDTAECPGSDEVKLCVNTPSTENKISEILQNNKNNPFFYISIVSIIINIIFGLTKFISWWINKKIKHFELFKILKTNYN